MTADLTQTSITHFILLACHCIPYFLDHKMHFFFMGSTVYNLYVSFILKVVSTIFSAAQIPVFAEG